MFRTSVQEREGSGGGEGERFRPEEILSSTTDHELWRLEVERVAPSLKITVKSEARDWRAHLEQMHQYRYRVVTINKAISVRFIYQ